MDDLLFQAADKLVQLTHAFSDADLDQPWSWRAHEEGVRFAFLGTLHELRHLAVQLAQRRAQTGPAVTAAQRALAQYHAAYRDLQAVLIGVTDEMYDREPAPGQWPLRYVVGHIVGAERHFFTLVHYGLERQRTSEERPLPLPEGEVDKVVGPYDDFIDIMENQGMAEMLAFYDVLHRRALREFATINDQELQGPSLWWEGEELSLQYRLHRFEAHLRQHTIQAEKTLSDLGRSPDEARRLLRLIYNALSEVESNTIGAEGLGARQRQELAATIASRAEEVTGVVEQAHQMQTAVQAGDLDRVQELIAANPELVDAVDQNGLPLVLTAVYQGQEEIARTLVESGANLNIFAAAALGKLEQVKEKVQAWPGWISEYNSDGFTPLQLACYFGREETARWLIAEGADVNAVAKNEVRIQPVHAAVAHGHVAILKVLLQNGADANARQQGGFTPLHTAADRGRVDMVRLLLQHGADANATAENGQTPLARALEKERKVVVDLLRQHGGHT